jgi:CBS domain-containing protein
VWPLLCDWRVLDLFIHHPVSFLHALPVGGQPMDRPRLASDIMVTRLVTLAPETHVTLGISHLLRHNISGAPVVDTDHNYLGVFSEKCCLNVLSVTAQLVRNQSGKKNPTQIARDFMATRLITLTPEMDVFEAIGYLLKHRISGAPVIGPDLMYRGVFSEKTSMKVLVDSAYDQLPTTRVQSFMNTDPRRLISDDTDLHTVMQMFLDTPYRRLPVLYDGRLLGQVSRRDALRAQNQIARYLDPKENEHAILKLSFPEDYASEESESPASKLQSLEVASFMDRTARTISPETDLFSIAHIFLSTPYRRLPVLEDSKLVGQVSRRDVLIATLDSMAIQKKPERKSLYLSSLVESSDAPFG